MNRLYSVHMYVVPNTMVLVYLILITVLHLNLMNATVAEQATEKWKCAEGWLLKLRSCYRWGTSQMAFSQAETQCKEWGSRLRVIRSEEENKLFTVTGLGNTYWLGVKYDSDGWSYQENGTAHYISYGAFNSPGSQQHYQPPYQSTHKCAVWNSKSNVWTAVPCNGNTYIFICQQKPDCVPGWFGANCSEECHCKGEVCNATTGICPKGCQLGWIGESCDVEKLKAEAKFYCFIVKSERMMLFRVNQRGTNYRMVSALDNNLQRVRECNKLHFSHYESAGMATLKVSQQKNGKYKPECGEHKVSDDIISWRFKFQEFPMTSSAYDILFEVNCDFTKADTLHKLVTSNTEKSSNKTTTLTESRVSVSFDILDAFDDQPLTTVKLGQQIKLQIKLDNGDDFGVTAVSPYNCSVSTFDNTNYVIILDEFGCPSNDAQIRFPRSDLTRWRSDVFEAFTFEGYDKVNFQCSFHVCFSEQHHYCQDLCTHSKKRKTRKLRKRNRSKKHRTEEDQELGTTVTIAT